MTDRDQIIADNPLVPFLEQRGTKVLPGAKQRMCKCPLHADGQASMSINCEKQVWFCHAGCGSGSVIDLLMALDSLTCAEAMKRLSPERPAPAPIKATPAALRESAVYRYTNEIGELLFEVVRYEPKTFRQRHTRDGKVIWGMDGVQRVLYNLPKLLNAKVSHIWLCEGEKDCDNLGRIGIVATTNVGGAGKWSEAYSETLRGKEIILCGDNDEPGRKHIEKVLASIADKAASIRKLALPPPHKDVSDFIAAQTDSNAAFTALCQLCENATVLTGGIELPVKSMRELETEYAEHIKNARTSIFNFSAWLPTLGRAVRGIVAGELIAVLAATGTGKTALLQNLALHAAPLAVLLFELELPGSLTFERFIQISNGESGAWVFNRYNSKEGVAWDCDKRLSNIFTCTRSRITPDDLETIINKSELKIGQRPALVILDYAQLVYGKGNTRYERASDVAERLRAIAKSTNTIIVFGSQIQRKKEDEGNEVYLHDGKESGSIENSSSLVLGMWRDNDDESLMFLKVLKNTKGRPGSIVRCNFHGDTLRITERSPVADVPVAYADI